MVKQNRQKIGKYGKSFGKFQNIFCKSAKTGGPGGPIFYRAFSNIENAMIWMGSAQSHDTGKYLFIVQRSKINFSKCWGTPMLYILSKCLSIVYICKILSPVKIAWSNSFSDRVTLVKSIFHIK